jgi:hypothetical protein
MFKLNGARTISLKVFKRSLYFIDMNLLLLFIIIACAMTLVLSSVLSHGSQLSFTRSAITVFAQEDGAQDGAPSSESSEQDSDQEKGDASEDNQQMREGIEDVENPQEQLIGDNGGTDDPTPSIVREIDAPAIPKPDYPSDCPPGTYFNVDSSRGKECLSCIPDVDPHPACSGSANPVPATQSTREEGGLDQSAHNSESPRGDPIPDVPVSAD